MSKYCTTSTKTKENKRTYEQKKNGIITVGKCVLLEVYL